MHADAVQHPSLIGDVYHRAITYIKSLVPGLMFKSKLCILLVVHTSFLFSNHISRNNLFAHLLKFIGLKNFKAHEDRNDVDYTVCWRRQWHPTPVLLPGKSHGRRSLVGCRPWGREESDTTERLHFHFSLSCIGEGNGNPLQCSCLENPRDGGPGRPPSLGSHRVGHDWSNLAAAAVHCL